MVARTAGAWAYGAAYAAGLRKAVRQAAEERFYRRGGNLRSGHERAPTVTPAKGRGLRVGLGLSVLPGPTSLSHRRPSFDPLHIAKESLTSLPPLIRATVKGKCGVGLVDCTPLKADAALKSETPRFTKPTTKVRLAPAFGPLL